ncbi:MAG: hypothetical protein ACJ79I_09965 [Gemmatimonadaceae bacterium]
MRYTHGEGVLFLALFAAFVACADPASRTVAPTVSPDITIDPGGATADEERVALTKIARLVAEALDNEPARQQLKRDLRAAPFREHKLELAAYLRSKEGRSLLDRVVALSARGEAELFGTLAAVRPLEFYMPVAKHRETWTGSADVLVVSQLDESGPLVAFDKQGREVTLDRKTAPEQPTLSIVPVETRFDQPMNPTTSRNVRDLNGNAIGTLERAEIRSSSMMICDETCQSGDGGGGGGSTPTIPPGLYLEFSRILDVKEPWSRGDPEIEVHIHGPTSTASPRYGVDKSCSGEHAYDYRKVFNQDGGFWEGRVMLFSPEEISSYVSTFNEGFHVFFWEDDNDPCVLKLDNNTLLNLVTSAATAFGTVSVKLIPGTPWPLVAGVFVATLFANAGSWLLTNDDFIGIAVDQTSAGYAYPGNTHVIMNGTTLNGRATIVLRQ